jgi:hypothetical protein
MMVALLVLGLLAFAFILWRNSQQVSMAATTSALAGTPVYTPKAPPVAESLAINSIPVIGPLASYTIDKAGNAIIQNKFLESHSQVGPNPGQTLASAGIAGVTVQISNKPIYALPGGAEVSVLATAGLSLLSSRNRAQVSKDLKFWDW